MTFRLHMSALRTNMMNNAVDRVLDGKKIAALVREQVACGVTTLAHMGVIPKLVVVQVGEDEASSIYVRHKQNDCKKVGIASDVIKISSDTSADELYSLLARLNADDDVDGILVQLPLPTHLDPNNAIDAIDPSKDVDGFHPMSLGHLMAWKGALEPCTPRGVMTMLQAHDIPVRGALALVVGRSMIVGRPMAHMLLRADATVTVCHRHTTDLKAQVAQADILVVATGIPELIKGSWIKPGAVVIDVGITRAQDGRLVGDVEFQAALERASWITPVPGGVGPMTRATLMENTVRACCQRRNIELMLEDKENS